MNYAVAVDAADFQLVGVVRGSLAARAATKVGGLPARPRCT